MQALVIFNAFHSSIAIQSDIARIRSIFAKHITTERCHKNVVIIRNLRFPHDAIFFLGLIIVRFRKRYYIIP
ncbi:hypothetical protein D3C71_1980310 [compost metagenome]